MQVTAWNSGGSTYGVRVGFPNRAAFFNPAWKEIEVEIDGELHTFKLTDGFWDHCPEFRSPVIRKWLQARDQLTWPRGNPPRFELLPLADNRFRLIP